MLGTVHLGPWGSSYRKGCQTSQAKCISFTASETQHDTQGGPGVGGAAFLLEFNGRTVHFTPASGRQLCRGSKVVADGCCILASPVLPCVCPACPLDLSLCGTCQGCLPEALVGSKAALPLPPVVPFTPYFCMCPSQALLSFLNTKFILLAAQGAFMTSRKVRPHPAPAVGTVTLVLLC